MNEKKLLELFGKNKLKFINEIIIIDNIEENFKKS